MIFLFGMEALEYHFSVRNIGAYDVSISHYACDLEANIRVLLNRMTSSRSS